MRILTALITAIFCIAIGCYTEAAGAAAEQSATAGAVKKQAKPKQKNVQKAKAKKPVKKAVRQKQKYKITYVKRNGKRVAIKTPIYKKYSVYRPEQYPVW